MQARRADAAAATVPVPIRCSPRRRELRFSLWRVVSQPWFKSLIDSPSGPPDQGNHRGDILGEKRRGPCSGGTTTITRAPILGNGGGAVLWQGSSSSSGDIAGPPPAGQTR